ncbi:DUF2752 domain-containing protein [Stenotrophomonas sp.]|uniref:DUF2752 domain-containing protein n=1 Tax=Stenotrophomonas sp. TaxID=69392 RepID=UPI0028AC0993|nr:DUF2752 domain-containing protein [Stenotrophomonas sp.]
MLIPQHLLRYAPLAAIAGIAVGAITILGRIDPNVAGNPLPSCPFYALTGIWCPGCGSTRCLHALVHGDLAQAMSMNPLLVVSIIPTVVMALHGAGFWPSRLNWAVRLFARPLLWMFVIFAFWIGRNLPWYPFNLLAPG